MGKNVLVNKEVTKAEKNFMVERLRSAIAYEGKDKCVVYLAGVHKETYAALTAMGVKYAVKNWATTLYAPKKGTKAYAALFEGSKVLEAAKEWREEKATAAKEKAAAKAEKEKATTKAAPKATTAKEKAAPKAEKKAKAETKKAAKAHDDAPKAEKKAKAAPKAEKKAKAETKKATTNAAPKATTAKEKAAPKAEKPTEAPIEVKTEEVAVA